MVTFPMVDDKTVKDLNNEEGNQSRNQVKRSGTQDQVDHGGVRYYKRRLKDRGPFQELGSTRRGAMCISLEAKFLVFFKS